MAPLPQNNTNRVRLSYTSLGRIHQFSFRPRIGDPTSFSAAATAVANALRSRMLATDSFFQAAYSLTLSDIFLPLAFTPIAGVVSGALVVWDQDPESTMLSICGRGETGGRRVDWSFFSPVRTVAWPADNRYGPGEEAVIDTWRINVTNALSDEDVRTIGGDSPIFYDYVNISQNAYWQRKQRRSG